MLLEPVIDTIHRKIIRSRYTNVKDMGFYLHDLNCKHPKVTEYGASKGIIEQIRKLCKEKGVADRKLVEIYQIPDLVKDGCWQNGLVIYIHTGFVGSSSSYISTAVALPMEYNTELIFSPERLFCEPKIYLSDLEPWLRSLDGDADAPTIELIAEQIKKEILSVTPNENCLIAVEQSVKYIDGQPNMLMILTMTEHPTRSDFELKIEIPIPLMNNSTIHMTGYLTSPRVLTHTKFNPTESDKTKPGIFRRILNGL